MAKGKSDVDGLFGRANRALDAGKSADAIALLTQAMALEPENAALVQSRGAIHAMCDELDLAVADYSRAIALSPKYADAHLNRGLAMWEKGKLKESAKDLAKALALGLRRDELTVQCTYFLARARERLGDTKKAYDDYLHVVVLAPDSAYGVDAADRSLAIRLAEERAHAGKRGPAKAGPRAKAPAEAPAKKAAPSKAPAKKAPAKKAPAKKAAKKKATGRR
jgi:tetratricopeptide (TPR) repeat protein